MRSNYFCFLSQHQGSLGFRSLPVSPLSMRTIQFIIIKRLLLIPLWGEISERRAALPSPRTAQGRGDLFEHLSRPAPPPPEPPNDIVSCQLISNPIAWQPRLAGKKLTVGFEGCGDVPWRGSLRWLPLLLPRSARVPGAGMAFVSPRVRVGTRVHLCSSWEAAPC